PPNDSTGLRPTFEAADLTCRPATRYRPLKAGWTGRQGSRSRMKKTSAVLAGALLSAAWVVPGAMAQPACVAANASVPPGANTTDRSAPFFIDTTGLDLRTAPPTRNPSNPNYPRATELPD